MTSWRLVQAETGATVVHALEIADTVWTRFKGLQLRSALPLGTGMLLVPCPSVHTFFMRFPIDVVLIDRAGRVVAIQSLVRPWRIVAPIAGAYATLELPGGTTPLAVGDPLRLEATSSENKLPPALAFLTGKLGL